MKTTIQQQILCLTMLMLLLASSSNDVVSAATSTTADTPAIAIPLDSIHMDATSASLRKGLRGLFVKRQPSSADHHHHHHHHGLSSMIPAATPGIIDNMPQLSSSIISTDIPITNCNTVRVALDHQKDGHGGDDHHSSSEGEQHHDHDHDQKHSKDDDKNKKQAESASTSSGNNKGRKFKVCMTHNHCYKKKLVCPKKCGNNKKSSSSSPTSSSRLLVPNHFPGHNNHCVLNCNKCVAHC